MSVDEFKEQLNLLKKSYEEGIIEVKKIIDLLEKNIKKLESGTSDLTTFKIEYGPNELTKRLNKIEGIFAHITNNKEVTINMFIVHYLKVTLFFYRKKLDIYSSLINKITKILALANSFNENIADYDLSSYVGKELLKDKAILTLLQIVKILNVDIQKNTNENVSYNGRKSMIIDGLNSYDTMISNNDSTEQIKLTQLNEYYDYELNLFQNDNNEVLNNLINNYWNGLKTVFLGDLRALNDYNINSGILVQMSPSSVVDISNDAFKRLNLSLKISNAVFQFNADENEMLKLLDTTTIQSGSKLTQTQSDLIAILKFYVNILNTVKRAPIKDAQSVKNRINLEAHIQNNINLLVETMLTKPISSNELPRGLKSDIEKKYSVLINAVNSENKKQQSLIKSLSGVKNDELNKSGKGIRDLLGTSVTNKIDSLAESIANELLYTEFYALNILSVGQKVNEKLLSKVPFGVVNAVKLKTLTLLKPRLKERMTSMLDNNIGSLKTKLKKLKAKYQVQTNQSPQNNQSPQLALEINVIEEKYNNLVLNKNAIIVAIEQYVDNWINKQNEKIRGLGFSETLEPANVGITSKSNMTHSSIQDTCTAIGATVDQMYTAHYFPLQFPNITKQKFQI
jgi:hypothetical protein